jgi:poly-beta-1,6-N-acetyl-D-glucosamine synthase
MTVAVFWFSLLFIFYTYAGYPLVLLVWKWLGEKPVRKKSFSKYPVVSVIVVARNEGANIGKRLANLFQQEYPAGRMEIVVVSDGSDDDTVAMAERARNGTGSRVSCRIVHYGPSRGKPTGLNTGVEHAAGEILVFTDCRQVFADRAIRELVDNFADPEVGGVSGELIFRQDDEQGLQAEMGAYWNYEKKIRKLESATGSMIGATGAIYAVRKSLFRPHQPATILDDVVTPLHVLLAGYRMVFDECAIAYDRVSADISGEWQRKVRTLTGNWQILSLHPVVLNPFNPGLFFRLFSHKVSRLLVPYCLIALLVCSALRPGMFYTAALLGQLFFYLVAGIAYMNAAFNKPSLVRLCSFFCVLNAAAFMSFWLWLSGRSGSLWKKSK